MNMTTNGKPYVLTDEELHYYGEQYQHSKEKQRGISFQAYLYQKMKKKAECCS